MKNMIKLGLVLAAYATAACVGLAFVYTGTAEIIAERRKAELEAALTDLFPQGDGFEEITGSVKSGDPSVQFINEYAINMDGTVAGVAIRAVGAGFSGPITVLVGVGAGGTITGVKVLENKDTPGLGANASSPSYFVDRAAGITFYGQFAGKALTDPFEVKADVEAITASTITSRAVADIVKTAGRAAGQWLVSPGGSM